MPPVQRFKAAEDKAAFILSPEFDINLYLALHSKEAISKDERQHIVEQLVARREKYDFDALIIKLTDICFTAKGALFIRDGASDFLADLLKALAQETDAATFVSQSKQALESQGSRRECAFPDTYQLSNILSHVFSLIQCIAKKIGKEKKDPAYIGNLTQNLTNKIFFPLLINSGSPQDGASLVTPFKSWAGTKLKDLNEYFFSRIPDEGEQQVDDYFSHKKRVYDNAIYNITYLIQHHKWQLGGIGLFKGGLRIEFNGEKIRVPHRVAAIAQLIKEFNNSSNKNIYELYEKIKEKAQEGLDEPRAGQKQSTRDFYQDVLANLYLCEQTIDSLGMTLGTST